MVTKIIKIGNSLGVIIPKPMLKSLGWKVGTKVEFEEIDENSFLVYKKAARKIKELTRLYKLVQDVEEKYGPALKKLAKR